MKFAGSKRKTYIKRTQTLTSILMCVTCDLTLRPAKVMESVYDGVPKSVFALYKPIITMVCNRFFTNTMNNHVQIAKNHSDSV